ncbi:MAG: TVP38/TMEM64 family protein [Acidobacteria bacterium]|nr:TVP38/TMEM64 family protein [Acidobacteriota bacterium]
MQKKTRNAILVLVAILALAAAYLLPLGQWALRLVEWVRGAGATGVVIYFLVYISATVLLLPGSILTLGAGFVYGPIFGTLFVSPASVLGATLAFLLGRSVARGWIAARVARNPKFAAIDEAVGRDGFKIVLLLRLSPVFPFSLLNYALGLTRVRLRDYVLASVIGMLPGTFLYVYLGSLITNAAQLVSGQRPQGGMAQQALFWGGLVATALVTALITRTARRALDTALAQNTRPEALATPEAV